LWAWLDKYNDEDAQIAVELIAHWGNPALLLELEAILLLLPERIRTALIDRAAENRIVPSIDYKKVHPLLNPR
jgi:hypothetical protein